MIDHTKVFNDRHGYVKQQLFHPDGIHLSKKGTSTFLHNINTCATIMQKHGTVFIVVKVDITNKHVDIHVMRYKFRHNICSAELV
jgi:hypothetical protein